MVGQNLSGRISGAGLRMQVGVVLFSFGYKNSRLIKAKAVTTSFLLKVIGAQEFHKIGIGLLRGLNHGYMAHILVNDEFAAFNVPFE